MFFFGLLLFNDMFTPVLTEILNGYELPIDLPSPFKGQDTHGFFNFDFRNLKDPDMGKGYITFFLDGTLTHNFDACNGPNPSEIYMDNETWTPCLAYEDDDCPLDNSET